MNGKTRNDLCRFDVFMVLPESDSEHIKYTAYEEYIICLYI